MSNLQVLCYRCNLEKRDRDDTDFLLWHNKLKYGRQSKCTYCKSSNSKSKNLAYESENKKGSLVIPTRHVSSFFEMIPAERSICLSMVDKIIDKIKNTPNVKYGVKFDVRGTNHYCIQILHT